MGEAVFFRNLTTKGLTAVNSGERYFEGYLTVQVKDKQGEVTIVDELMKVLPVWIDRGAPISDTHSNRIIGKGINYSKVEYKDKDGEIYPAIKVTGKIHKNYELDNDIWMKIKSGEYKGLSFGGATKSDREPMRMKDGSIAYSLKDLEHYEVAVCRDPAVPLALITEFNTLAKAAVDGQDLGDGRMLIKCDKFGCYVDKENREAGLKAPEARNEALVYDDKTHDQPSETPEENQKKVKKGKDDAKDAQHMDESEAVFRHATGQDKGVRDSSVAGKEDIPKQGQQRHDLAAENKAEDWSNADGDMQTSMNTQNVDEGGMGKHKQKRDSVLQGYGGEQNNTGEVGWSGSGSPYPKKKGDGSRDHTRNAEYKRGEEEQDEVSSEHKTHNTPVPLKTHGKWIKATDGHEYYVEFPEYYPTGTVDNGGKPGKTGKKKGYSDEFKEDKENWEQQEYDKTTKKPRKKKKKAVITNIYTRLKNLDTLYKKHVANKDPDIEQVSAEHATHNTPTYPKRTYEDQWDETLVIEDDGMGSKEGMPLAEKKIVDTLLHVLPANWKKPNKKKKAVITNIHTRLKNLDFMLKPAALPKGTPNPNLAEVVDEITHPDLTPNQWKQVHQEKREHYEDKPNDEERWDALDRLHEGGYHREQVSRDKRRVAEIEADEAKRELARKRTGSQPANPKKKSYFARVKDGEFGGMNTGEVEWTEPRDTANSRTKRDKDVA